jgi:transcriptional regulator with XRE-family HTH domain
MREVPKAEGQDQKAAAQGIKVDFVGSRLRDIREHVGQSLEETAQGAGLTPAVLEAIESGVREPTALELMRIADGLGVPFLQLFGPLSPAALAFTMAFEEAPEEVQEAVRAILSEPRGKA